MCGFSVNCVENRGRERTEKLTVDAAASKWQRRFDDEKGAKENKSHRRPAVSGYVFFLFFSS